MGNNDKDQTRREFLVGAGAIVATGAVGVIAGSQALPSEVEKIVEIKWPFKYPKKSEGYLVVDTKKCASCQSCMFACSTAHVGKGSASQSNIQIIPNTFDRFPDDIKMEQCRQCVYPICVFACPTGALHVDAENGNVRMGDTEKCIGCQLCMNACPFIPHRPIWDPEETAINGVGAVHKCDLCADTPYWNEQGGPDGKQACVEVCPMRALTVVKKAPDQRDKAAYDVNLRTPYSAQLGLSPSY